MRIERTAQDTYRYQADNEGDWGEFALDPDGELKIIALAELDTVKTHRFAEQAASYLRAHEGATGELGVNGAFAVLRHRTLLPQIGFSRKLRRKDV